ncbi:hypothetical protein KI659_06790 [Litoribacter alkaliphilus]|uniref:Collagen-like protein n=1 Tax=Litoribacter ruber TaxID=702568 RepID=A0AAP2CHJ0_9BACT|nr:hypothetical protein [Litoribacter alkaliphilus]MBS9523724.1 hypothetical protein [Litoribacter alkaliphilus]
MKKLLLSLSVLGAFLIQACQGPMGPPGLDGIDGITVEADVFEVVGDFDPEANFTIQGDFNELGLTFLESDKLLIYHLWETDEGRDVWRILPQTIYLDQGQFAYQYDFTNLDFRIFMQGNFDLNILEPDWRNEQYFRLVVVPTRAVNFRVDFNDYEAVVDHYNLDTSNIPRIRLGK